MKNRTTLRFLCLLLALICLAGCAAPPIQQPETTETSSSLPSEPTAGTEATEPTETLPPEIVVSSFGELSALASGDTLVNGDTVHLTEDMEITEEIVLKVPVTLIVESDVVSTCPIVFDTDEAGTVQIRGAQEGVDIRFDTPNCHVLWENAPYSSEEQAAELMNVRSFNGVDLREKYGLGGTGQRKIRSFAVDVGQSAPLVWQIEGNTAHLAVTYLTADSVLKSAAVQITMDDGTVVTESMDLTEGDRLYALKDASGEERVYKIITQRITYNLPVFYIEIEGGQEVTSKEYYLSATLRIDTGTAVDSFPGMDTTEMLIRGRGHYSWRFDKTPYKLRFEKKTSVMGMNASKNWVLLANYVDRSLIQNHVAMEMGKVMTNIDYHSNQYPVDVFVNGSYRGVYTFGEQLEAKKERLNLVESYTEVDTDYLLELGGTDEEDVKGRDYFHAGTLRFAAIKHPDSEKLTQEQLDYLMDYVQTADDAVRTLTDYEQYIDVDSLIDWVIIHEMTYNLDCCFRRSCYLIKEKGGKLKMGPIWDFDLAFGSFFRYQSEDWATVGESGGYVGVTWMNYLKEDEAFMTRFRARWNEIKEPLMNRAVSAVDRMGALVQPSAEMNFQVWPLLGQSVPSQPASHMKYDTYEKMVQRLKSFLWERYNWLDQELN